MILVTGATGPEREGIAAAGCRRGVLPCARAGAQIRLGPKALAAAAARFTHRARRHGTLPRTARGGLCTISTGAMLDFRRRHPTMLDVQSNFINAARKAGVKHVVKLSGIMARNSIRDFRFARMHGEIEKKAGSLRNGRLRICGPANSWRPTFARPPTSRPKGAMFLPNGRCQDRLDRCRRYRRDRGPCADQCGARGAKPTLLTRPRGADHGRKSQKKLSAAIGKTVRYVNVPPEGCAASPACRGGCHPILADAFVSNCSPSDAMARRQRYGPTPERCLGGRPTSFDEFARRNTSVFRGEAPPPRV